MRSNGVHVVRWFLFADGRASPEFNAQGYVTGFDEHFYTDFDAAMNLACEHDLHLVPVLLDYQWLNAPTVVNGVQLGGHADIITDTVKRQSFLDNALAPLLQRYGNDRRIIAWDVINEPEWKMSGIPGGGTIPPTVTTPEMQAFVNIAINYIHSIASQDVTLGSAQGMWLSYWQNTALDFYQFHHFPWMGYQSPFVPYSSLGLDKPAILGEFQTTATISVTDYLSAAWNNGYAGALGWSLNGQDSTSNFRDPAISEAFRTWSQLHTSAVNIPGLCVSVYLPITLKD